MRRGGTTALDYAGQFFRRSDPVHQTLQAIARKLEEHQIPYAIEGGMALVAHGHDRTTVDVDILTTPQGLAAVHDKPEGLGHAPPFPNSRHLRDTQTGVRVVLLVSGQFPGDGKPKPVAFPDRRSSSFDRDGVRYLTVPALVELKLASGMTHPGRLKDLADVQELIRVLNLPPDFARQLNPYVQGKFAELWSGLHEGLRQEPEQ